MGSLLDQLKGGRTSKPKSRGKISKSRGTKGGSSKFVKKSYKTIKKPGGKGKGKP